MAERCDFYSDEEYQQYLAFEEERYKEEQAKKEYEEECAYQEYLNNNKFSKRYVDCDLVENALSQKIVEVNQNMATKHLEGGLILATEIIRTQPTINIVRCDECIMKNTADCYIESEYRKYAEFCSFGERTPKERGGEK